MVCNVGERKTCTDPSPTKIGGRLRTTEVFGSSNTHPSKNFLLLLHLIPCLSEMGKVAPSGPGHLRPEVPIGPWAPFLSLLGWLWPCGEECMA